MASARRNMSRSARITGMDHPFAQGAFRWVAMGHYTEGPRNGQKCVAKWFKSGAVYENDFFDMDIMAVDKAQAIVDAFNAQGIITSTIFLNHPEVWVFDEYSTYAGQKTLTEPFIENFEKFNSNSGVVFGADGTNWSSLMQALSHFSYHMTGGHYVLCDLQGGIITKGKGKGSAILTDPVILSRNRDFGVTDLGSEGISTFFGRHHCNQYCCDHWQLPRDRRVIIPANVGTTMVGFNQRQYQQYSDDDSDDDY